MKKGGKYSLRSLFHGFSLLLIFAFLLLATLGLSLINLFGMYSGNGNGCLAKNTVALYGEDNVLYCPNTFIVSSLNVTDTSFSTIAITTPNITKKEMEIVSSNTLQSPVLSIYLDYQAETFWWFNLNTNSKLDISFIGITSSHLSLVIDDDDVVPEIPSGDSSFEFLAKEGEISRGYKVKIKSSNINDTEINVGSISFNLAQTSYGNSPTSTSQLTCSNGINCYWDFDFAENICISFTSISPRNWGSEDDGNCVILSQEGYDHGWALGLYGVSVVFIILITAVNLLVIYLLNKRKNNYMNEFN